MKAKKPVDGDVYFKKTVAFKAWKHSLQFKISQDLFSSHDIDLGTRFLLRSIVESDYTKIKSIFDLGCGYGPIGLTLKKLYKDCLVHMVDRDALAVEYSRQNAALNGLDDVEVYGSLGYEDAKRADFDLIVSNIPGKAGEPVVAYFLREARYYLAPNGLVAVVVVEPLEEIVAKVLSETPGLYIILKRTRPGHTVFHYRFSDGPAILRPDKSALERGIYLRNRIEMRFQNLKFPMQTAYGLPEFDSWDYGSEMLMKALRDLKTAEIRQAVVFNPGQGHTAVALWKLIRPGSITLVDRDLLALRYSKLNLGLNECPAQLVAISHQVGANLASKEEVDLFVGVLRDEEGPGALRLTIEQAAQKLSPNGVLIVSAGSTAITRLITHLQSRDLLRIRSRERWRGNSLLVMERA